MHASIESASDESILVKEKENLEKYLCCKVSRIRQHWLKYHEDITLNVQEKYFKYDSTIGWNDRIGFRSGCASCYRLYDHVNQKASKLYEIPQIIMDSNIFEYSNCERKEH